MRLFLVAIVVLCAVNIGHDAIQKQYELQEQRLEKWCEIDQSYCVS